jgi:hypothetical protein
MASTAGGFLLGFGLYLLIFSLFLSVVVEEAYRELEKYRSDIEMLYSVTHSSEYRSTLIALETASSYAVKIRNALCHPAISWMGLCYIGETLESSITGAAGKMREIQALSEKLYAATAALPAVGNILWAASMAGLVMIAIGVALIIRARRVKSST